MLRISIDDDGIIVLSGRLDASKADEANDFFRDIKESMTVDMKDLDYISSAGLGVFLRTQKRLHRSGNGLKLIHMNDHVRDVFGYSGFDQVFEIE